MATASASSQPVSGQPATPPQENTQNTSPPTEGGRPTKYYVRLYTKDKHSFYIDRQYALVSPTLGNMMADPCAIAPNEKSKTLDVVLLQDMSSHVVSKVCEYFVYKKKYEDGSREIPSFRIEREDACELFLAAHFLRC